MESELLKSFEHLEGFVMATGGGTPCFFNNIEYINSTGTSFYIQLDTKSIFNRLSNAKNIRPTIKDKKEDDLMTFIEETFQERKSIYEQAHFTVNGLHIETKQVIALL